MAHAPSNKVHLIVSAEENQPPCSKAIRHVVNRWGTLEEKLMFLHKHKDNAERASSDEAVNSNDIEAAILSAEEEQLQLVYDISELPAQNRSDVMAKFELWKSIAMPEETGGAPIQPIDWIIASVMRDFINRADQNE